MTAFRRGDVVLVGFPFTDLASTKMRPALVVSSDVFNNEGLDIILVAITSQISRRPMSSDYALSTDDQKQAGLPKPSIVKLGKIVTLDRRVVRKRLGSLADPTLSLLTLRLHKALE